ncbi:Chemotaxis protein CheY [bacterium HR17]|jgi:two-component system chemotaxis response regulator CheY|uniref:Chemotaxis protein CheY n=1 Tax=Candidatus Fervidibacter japonicus TaxID=2035412 RepID=A0A2H5XEZ8_9BACT|nr:Chemotaxis protein CheY [bacterium HR17]
MPKVLVADDAAFIRMKLRKVLEELGLEVVEAANGAEAVRQFQEHRPDLVLLDITMPEMDGLSALKSVMQLDTTARVVMVSALGQESVVMQALQAGAKDFVVKPFQPEQIKQVVQRWLSQ